MHPTISIQSPDTKNPILHEQVPLTFGVNPDRHFSHKIIEEH